MKWYPLVRSRRCRWLRGARKYVPSLSQERDRGFCATVVRFGRQLRKSLVLPLKGQVVNVDIGLALVNLCSVDSGRLDDPTQQTDRRRGQSPLLHAVWMRIIAPVPCIDLLHEIEIKGLQIALTPVLGLKIAHGQPACLMGIQALLVLPFVPLDRPPEAPLLGPLVRLGLLASVRMAIVHPDCRIDVVDERRPRAFYIIDELLPLHIAIVLRQGVRNVALKPCVFRKRLVIEIPIVLLKLTLGLATATRLLQSRGCILDVLCHAFLTAYTLHPLIICSIGRLLLVEQICVARDQIFDSFVNLSLSRVTAGNDLWMHNLFDLDRVLQGSIEQITCVMCGCFDLVHHC